MFKKAIVTFLTSLLIVSHAAAQSLTLLGVGSAGALQPNGLTFQGSQACTPSSGNCTAASLNFGAAQSNRYIIVEFHNSFGCTATATIGGVSATKLKEGAFSNNGITIFGANVTSGTTGTIATTCSTDTNQEYIGWYTIYGLNSLTNDSTCQASNGSSCSLSPTVNNGYAMCGTTYFANVSTTLNGTGAVTDYSVNFVGTNQTAVAGHAPTTGATLALNFVSVSSNVAECVAIH